MLLDFFKQHSMTEIMSWIAGVSFVGFALIISARMRRRY